MKLINVAGRLCLAVGSEAFDVETASSGRFGPEWSRARRGPHRPDVLGGSHGGGLQGRRSGLGADEPSMAIANPR
jgi:hypothetical protein